MDPEIVLSAADSLLDEGMGTVTEGLELFSDDNIVELLANLEVPISVRGSMENPERIFDALPDLSSGLDARQRINTRINNKTDEIKKRINNRAEWLRKGQQKICLGIFKPCALSLLP